MSECCSGGSKRETGVTPGPFEWFSDMIDHCLDYATKAKKSGRPIVCIMCEYTPRELILAAGGVPICLCGGSAETIPAAEKHLPANLCPLIKSTFGYHVGADNPFLEMADLVVGETTCDGKKKMFELMGQTRPMYVLQLPQKSLDSESLGFWTRELQKFRSYLSTRFGVPVGDDALREAIGLMNRERALRRELAALMSSSRPPLTGLELLELKSTISAIPEDLDQYARTLAILSGLSGDEELASRVRVLMTGVPMVHGAERVLEIVENSGGLVVAQENCTGLKPLLEDVDPSASDPIQALAEKYYHLPCSVMTPNDGRLDTLRHLVEEYRPDCVIDLVWQACLTYDVESARVQRLADEELSIPYLRIETDYSPSDSVRIGVRVEALFETIRGNRRS